MESYVPPTYEDLPVKLEPKETRESHLLLVHIPDGFARENVGAKFERDFVRVRVFGERSLGNNRSCRFNEVYQVPANCDTNRIWGKFEGGIITITMPKKVHSEPKQETEPTEQETPKTPTQETEPNQEKDKEDIPPKSETGDDQGKTTTTDAEVKDQKGQEGISNQETSATEESMPQKGEKGISQDATVTKVESKEEASHEPSTPPKAIEDSMPQKDQKLPQKETDTTEAKLQTEENFAEQSDENKEKQRVAKEESKDHPKKRKIPEDDDSLITGNESKKEKKGLATVPCISHENTEEKEKKEKEINGEFGADAEKESSKMAKPESTMKKVASQVVTRLRERFNEEDKQKLIYIGAAVVVVALGVYASYKFRSSRRP
ncbi:inactive protein RESTRICTED TEV MOVEMENT 2-like [Gastrolobium bilobum]|uniref:inactive protein RESTRICTED TEV MOVEMENT 2-like n=1 Tax=Gastrolobium bilobum TaxID=150636 RepID=UPI002AB0DD1A|nr:inactive protein RESTRICTED TEV MOVEMENT 2-like [Gastrolobium bilobum]